MTNKFFAFIIALLFAGSVFAQTETLLTEGVEKQLEIAFNNENYTTANTTILSLVAKAKALPEHAVKLNYTVKEHRKIIKNSNKLQLQLSVGNYVFNDDINYLKFNINKFLNPSLISYTYIFTDANDNVLESKTLSNVKFKNGAFLLKKSVENNYQSDSYKLYLDKLQFVFSEQDAEKIEEYMLLIDDYYSADARLNMLEQELAKITTDSIELLQQFKQITLDNIKALNEIRSERYVSKLRLDANDPIQFKSHFGRVEVQNRTIKKDIERTLDNMHITYYKKGKDWHSWGDLNKSKQFFEKSIAEKYNYAPPYFELAQMDFNNGLYGKAIDSCAMILTKFKPDTDTRYNAVKLAEAVIYKYIKGINLDIENREFASAVEKLKVCENYSSSIPGVKHFQEFNEIHGKLYKAYYLDLVELAKVQIDQMKLNDALFSIDSLKTFRKAHTQYILNAEKEHELLKLLYSAWMEAGQIFMENQVADSALYSFTQANIICHKHEVVYCTEELNEYLAKALIGHYNYMVIQAGELIDEQLADSALAILNNAEEFRIKNNLEKNHFVETLLLKGKQLKYADLIKAGSDAFSNKQTREALAFYDEALALEKEYAINTDTTLQIKIEHAAQNYIALLCIQGETFVEALHISNAKQKLLSAQNIYNYYNMTDNNESTLAINSLKERLKEGKCDQVSYNYNIQVIAAQKFIEMREFVFASNALDKAQRIKRNNEDCELSDTLNNRLKVSISPMLHYQKKYNEINELVQEKSYNEVVEEYSDLTDFYNDSCSNNFGIMHLELFSYISTHKNPGVIDYAVKFYTEQGNMDTALIVLEKLKEHNYEPSWTKENQMALGKQLALKDIELESDENIDPKVKVIDYTKADKWYKYLRKSYLAQWKLN